MKRIKVMIPFHLKATDTIYVPDDEIEVSEEQLAKIQAIRQDMVAVLGEVEEPTEEPIEEPAEEPEPKKRKTTKKPANK